MSTVWVGEVSPTWTSPKSRPTGEIRSRPGEGGAATPLPARLIETGWPVHVGEEVAEAGPAAVGSNRKNIWQESPGWRVLPWQFWVAKNGAPGAPPTPDITTGALPTLVMSTDWVGETVPTSTSPKSRE